MKTRTLVLAALAVAGSATLAGCSIAGPPCSNTNDCVLKASVNPSNGNLVITRSEAPSANAIIPQAQPSPSFPATAYRECIAANGDPSTYNDWNPNGNPYRYECDSVNYVGNDGAYYSTDITVNGVSLADGDTAGIGATERECVKGWYPQASSGNPAGIPGKWDAAVGLCLPTTNSNSQFAS